MGVGAGLYMCDVVKSSRSLSHLLMSSCLKWSCQHGIYKLAPMGVETCTDGGEIWHGGGDLHHPKFHPHLRFFAPQGRHVAPMGVKFGTEEGTEKPQNRPLSKLNTGRLALRAMLPVII